MSIEYWIILIFIALVVYAIWWNWMKRVLKKSPSEEQSISKSPPIELPKPSAEPAQLPVESPSKRNISPAKNKYEEIAFIDLETTGLSPEGDRIIEVALLIISTNGDNTNIDGYSEMAHPGRPIPGQITKLTGISDKMVADLRSTGSVVNTLLDKIGGRMIAAYNAKFDVAFLKAEATRLKRPFNNKWLCIMEHTKSTHPNLHRYRLVDVCEAFGVSASESEKLGISTHRAMYDAELALRLFVAVSNGRKPKSESLKDGPREYRNHSYDNIYNYQNLNKYNDLRKSAKNISVQAKSDESTDINQAIHGYKSAIAILKDAGKINIYSDANKIDNNAVKNDSGDIHCLNRLTLCLCKLKRGHEAAEAAADYFSSFPNDSNLKAAEQIHKRIAKATIDKHAKEQDPKSVP